MADNRVRLVHEIDATPSPAAAQQVEQQWERTHGGIDKGAQRTARVLSQATRAMSSAIGAVTSAAAASDRQWLALGTTILASFAAGGPIAGGIAIVGAGVGLLAGAVKDASKASEEHKKIVEDLERAYEDLNRQIRFIEREGREPSSIEDRLEAQIDLVRRLREEFERASSPEARRKAASERGLFDIFGTSPHVAARQALERAEAELDRLQRLADAERNRNAVLGEQVDIQKELEAIEKERMGRALAGLGGAQGGLSSAQSFAAALNRPRSLGEDLAGRIASTRGEMERVDAILANFLAMEGKLTEAEVARGQVYVRQRQVLEEQLGIYEGLVEKVREIESPEHRFGEFIDQQTASFRTSLGPALSNTVADALTDGLDTGFDNAGDIARRFFLGLFNQAASLLVMKAIGSALPGLFVAKGAAFSGGRVIPFARGGVVDRPTLFPMANGMGLMGEAGPEAVLPLKRGRGGRLGVEAGGGGTSIQFGDIHLSRDFMSIPQEEQARLITDAVLRRLRTNTNARTLMRRGGV